MTQPPNKGNSKYSYTPGKRLGAEQVREYRHARLKPIQGRVHDTPQYKPRPSQKFQTVGSNDDASDGGKPGRRWTIWKIGLTTFGIVALLFLGLYAIPLGLQLRDTVDQMYQPEERLVVVQNEDGSVETIPESELTDDDLPNVIGPTGGSNNDDDTDDSDGNAAPELPDWDNNDRINVLLMGVDSRSDSDDDVNENENVARSDTMIIVTIDPETDEVGMLSLPRDMLVDIPGYGMDKINHAYSHGEVMENTSGRALVRATVEYNFDIPIHYYSEVDFVGFTEIVDTIGGVVVNVPAPIKDDEYEWTRVYFPTGLQHMDGARTLQYVRTRHDDNDFGRGARQQQVLVALRQQGVRLGLVTRANELLEDVGDTIRTDFSVREMLALARMANEIENEDIKRYNLLEATRDTYRNGAFYLEPDWDMIDEILDEMMPERTEQPAVGGSGAIDYDSAMLVQNGTFINRFAGSHAELLRTHGFSDITTQQHPDAGTFEESQIIDYTGDPTTARELANLMQLPDSAVVSRDPSEHYGYDVVIILGEDAPGT